MPNTEAATPRYSVLCVDDEQNILRSIKRALFSLKIDLTLANSGEKDRRVPFEQAEAFKAALTQSGKEFQWFVRATETHGFYGEDTSGK